MTTQKGFILTVVVEKFFLPKDHKVQILVLLQIPLDGFALVLRCGIAEKRRTLICISLDNKRITKHASFF